MDVQGLRREAALTLLREAGFVRGTVIEKAYREGYERYGYEHLGEGCPMPDEDDPDHRLTFQVSTMDGLRVDELRVVVEHVERPGEDDEEDGR